MTVDNSKSLHDKEVSDSFFQLFVNPEFKNIEEVFSILDDYAQLRNSQMGNERPLKFSLGPEDRGNAPMRNDPELKINVELNKYNTLKNYKDNKNNKNNKNNNHYF